MQLIVFPLNDLVPSDRAVSISSSNEQLPVTYTDNRVDSEDTDDDELIMSWLNHIGGLMFYNCNVLWDKGEAACCDPDEPAAGWGLWV